VSAKRITVKNFAGAAVPVLITSSTTVIAIGMTGLVTGLSVSVVGTKATNGTVTATRITARPSNG
jgi:hypothetical protein